MMNPCCDKKKKNKGACSKQEDQKSVDFLQAHGDQGCWESIPSAAGLLRCGKSRRLRLLNDMQSNVNRGHFKEDEEDLIIKLHTLLGDRWSLIAGRIPGRTDNEIKNYWNSHLKKKIADRGINQHSRKVNKNRPARKGGDHDQMRHEQNDGYVSDATSLRMDDQIMEEKSARKQQLPDLNLDLTLSFPCDHDPTLLLFR